jgi:hypothetical protein
MSFDIRQLDKADPDDSDQEEALAAYQDALIERLYNSPEGQAFSTAHPETEMGFWAAQLMYYGYAYVGVTIPQMTVSDVEEIVTELFPRKISLFSADEADDAIPELVALWQFLKREYQLSNADSILQYLHQIEPEFKAIIMDSSKFGMAKSLFMMGHSAGYDMTDKQDIDKFMMAYNANVLAQGPDPALPSSAEEGPFDLPGGSQKATKKKPNQARKKKARKIAKASRKKNRKKRK